MKKTINKIQKNKKPFFILGPCVIESRELCLEIAKKLKLISDSLQIEVYFKASYDKANRSSIQSYRGLGIDNGLKVLAEVRETTGLPILTDVHSPTEAKKASEVVDMLQTPAFLCRQTNLIEAVAKTGKPVNYKKGQFLSPMEMKNLADKALAYGANPINIYLCERGFSFGYNNLVVDMRSLEIMKSLGYKVVFDVTHSVQLPGGSGITSGGTRKMIPVLAKAAAAVGVHGFFLETHPEPKKAKSDSENCWHLDKLEELIKIILKIHNAANF